MPASHVHAGTTPSPAALYRILKACYGELKWWPADGPFQVMVGAVLTQRTTWRNVEVALLNLKEAGVNDMDMLLSLPTNELERLIRPSGTYRQKAARLRGLFETVNIIGDGSLEAFLRRPVDALRMDLLAIKGIGPETADSIILYAAGQPVFVVDAYTRRVLGRLEIDVGPSYDDVARWFIEGLPRDADMFNNYHAVLVELAKRHCRPKPLCETCPLLDICPTGMARYQDGADDSLI